jgi:hypothetical protein
LSRKGQGHLSGAGERALSGAPRMPNVMKCLYKGCRRPCESRKFHVINGESESGGQDWTQLAGSVLSDACHAQYSKRGTLERSQVQHEHLVGCERRCSYEGCKRPTMGQVDDLQLDDLRLEESPMGSTATAHQNLLHSQACGEENHVQSELDSLARRRRFGLDIDRAEMTIREKRLRWRQHWIVYDNFKRKSLIHS